MVDVLALGREDQDGDAVLAAQLAADREPVLAGKHEVEDHEVGLEPLEALAHRQPVTLDEHLVVVALEVVANGRGQPLAVLDQ